MPHSLRKDQDAVQTPYTITNKAAHLPASTWDTRNSLFDQVPTRPRQLLPSPWVMTPDSDHSSPGNYSPSHKMNATTPCSPTAEQSEMTPPRPLPHLRIPDPPEGSIEVHTVPQTSSSASFQGLSGIPNTAATLSFKGMPTQAPKLRRAAELASVAARATHTNSKTWVNPKIRDQETWLRIERNMKKVFHKSPFVPQTMEDWLAHRRGRQEDAIAEQEKRLAWLEACSRRSCPGLPPFGPRVKMHSAAFHGRLFNDNLSAVLAIPTMWSWWHIPTAEHPEALWPCAEEMKEEGDERMTSGFRRFPALPRVPGNETVVYKQKFLLKPLPFDATWTKEDIEEKARGLNEAADKMARRVDEETAKAVAEVKADYVAEGRAEAVARDLAEAIADGFALTVEMKFAEAAAVEAETEYKEMEGLLGSGLLVALDCRTDEDSC